MPKTWTTAKPANFFASEGKYHAAHRVSGTAICGASATLDTATRIMVVGGVDSSTVHPIVCKNCLRLATLPGYNNPTA